MTSLPQSFLILTHEGLSRVQFSYDAVQSMDNILSKFTAERFYLAAMVADSPYGYQHHAAFVTTPPRAWQILELTRGTMVLNTAYDSLKNKDGQSWVYPTFGKGEKGFTLRCLFDFEIWAKAGLRLFLGLNPATTSAHLWVYYNGQIYRPPFGNIFESTAQICLGPNKEQYNSIFKSDGQTDSVSLAKTMQLLNDSMWNADTFNSSTNLPILKSLVRFDADSQELPMLPPLEPALITKANVITHKDLAIITTNLIAIYG